MEDSGQILGIDVSACVDVAYSMLPVEVPKPIFEQGVWKDILGHGHFLRDSFSQNTVGRPLQFWTDFPGGPTASVAAAVKKPRIRAPGESPIYAKVVHNKSELSWEEERESLLQSSLKRWLATLQSCSPWCSIRSQLDAEESGLFKLQVLADIFRGRSPSTLLKRVRSVEKLVRFFGYEGFPTNESEMYNFLRQQRDEGAPPSRLRSFLEATSFCAHVLDMDVLLDTEKSRRCAGTTKGDVAVQAHQASPLRVSELQRLHEVLEAGER